LTLRLLSESPEYVFAPGTFDVRGWKVMTPSSQDAIGVARDLVLDTSNCPRYLAVVLEAGDGVLIPIGEARVDAAKDEICIPGLTPEQLQDLPRFSGRAAGLTPEYEAALCKALTPQSQAETVASHATELLSMNAKDEFKVDGCDDDPRGWIVRMGENHSVGTVRDLLFDTNVLKVRHLVVELAGAHQEARSVLVPSVYAQLDGANREVRVDAISTPDLERLPTYRGIPVAASQEDVTLEVFTGGSTAGDQYRHPRFNPSHFFGPRQNAARATAA
jgi:hypothetical protein